MNIRQELEALAEAWEEEYSELSEHSMQGATFRNCATELRQVIQRIPKGLELRPREPSAFQMSAVTTDRDAALERERRLREALETAVWEYNGPSEDCPEWVSLAHAALTDTPEDSHDR